MSRQTYLDLARNRHAVPVGADLVLQEKPDAEAILLDGDRLGAVIAEAAQRYGSPLAIPLMDLRVEKDLIGQALGMAPAERESFHLDESPDEAVIDAVRRTAIESPTARMRATARAVRHVAERHGELVPIGMGIGPFSLMVKLIAEPIMPVYSAATGTTPEDDPEVAMLFAALRLSLAAVLEHVRHQLEAGAKAMFICEPAANVVYLSPRTLASSESDRPDIFDRCVLDFLRPVRELLEAADADLILHDCGELTDEMVRRLGHEVRPAVLSLGSSRELWRDAALVPDDVVLYGNLPSKRFFSDSDLDADAVEAAARELVSRMGAVGHPFILGSECDVLHVPGCEATIREKVRAITARCGRGPGCGCPVSSTA